MYQHYLDTGDSKTNQTGSPYPLVALHSGRIFIPESSAKEKLPYRDILISTGNLSKGKKLLEHN